MATAHAQQASVKSAIRHRDAAAVAHYPIQLVKDALREGREPLAALRLVSNEGQSRAHGQVVDSTADLVRLLNVGRTRHRQAYWALRRTFEAGLVALALPFLLPLLALIALAIKIEDGGSIFYTQDRLGERLRTFRIFKFRTMVPHAAAEPAPILDMTSGKFRRPSSDEDPRVTGVGRFLRRWSLDELPQMLNILVGDMSLVGPRPLTVRESLEIPVEGFARYSVPAGLTGLAQVRDREIVRSPSRFNADIEYVNTCGVILDLRIVLRTFGALRQK